MNRNSYSKTVSEFIDKYGSLSILSFSFILGWVITFLIRYIVSRNSGFKAIDGLEVSTKFVLFVFAWQGWIWGLIAKGKKIHHSGISNSRPKDLSRYLTEFGMILGPLFIVGILLLLCGFCMPASAPYKWVFMAIFSTICFAFLGTIVSELIYDNPLEFWLKPIGIQSSK